MKKKSKQLSSKHLIKLRKEMKRFARAEEYLEDEMSKIIKSKKDLQVKIRKEKEILRLNNRIKRLKK